MAASLSSEIASLVHHVELNKAGWWDKGIQRFVLAAIWLGGRSLRSDEIVAELHQRFFVNADAARIKQQAEVLCAEGTLVPLPNDTYKISEQAQKEFETTLQEAELVLAYAKNKFVDLFAPACPSFAPEEAWLSFNEDLLMPLVKDTGARTYELISGANLHLDRTMRLPEYLQRFPNEHRQSVRAAIVRFLDPSDGNIRSYILRHLNAYFLAEASNLATDTLESLAQVAEHPPSFKIFADTNFLFSILELRDNPSNEAANALMQVLTQLPPAVECQLYVLTSTLDEARGVLTNQRDLLKNVSIGRNMADAMSEMELGDIAQRFVEASRKAGHAISATDYFDPYIKNVIRIVRSRNVNLYNQNIDTYRLRQDVIDSVVEQLHFEQRKYGEKGRTYEQLLHDVVLWYVVRDKRSSLVESPLQATYWIVTIDYHFLGFDAYKRRTDSHQVSICLHPTALIQMLQFWLPRTPQFEEAVLGSLRWPFLFQDFDLQTEQVTIRILEALARFEGVGDLPGEIIANILLDDALRSRLSFEKDVETRVELVKEALIKESERKQFQLREERERVQAQLRIAEQEASALSSLNREQATAISDLEQRVARQESALADAQERIRGELKARAGAEQRLARFLETAEAKDRRDARRNLSMKLLFVLALSQAIPIGTSFIHRDWLIWKTKLALCGVGLFLWTWISGFLISRCAHAAGWPPTQRFLRFRKWLFAAFGAIVLGAVGNALWEYVKNVSK